MVLGTSVCVCLHVFVCVPGLKRAFFVSALQLNWADDPKAKLVIAAGPVTSPCEIQVVCDCCVAT